MFVRESFVSHGWNYFLMQAKVAKEKAKAEAAAKEKAKAEAAAKEKAKADIRNKLLEK